MRLSPFHPRTSEYCEVNNWSLWQNGLLADMYAPDHIQEYLAVRTACAVFDVSPIPKYHITGPDAVRLLHRMCRAAPSVGPTLGIPSTTRPSMVYTCAVQQPIPAQVYPASLVEMLPVGY